MRVLLYGAIALAIGVIVALVIVASAYEANVPEEPIETSVDAVVDVPQRFGREPVRISGTVVPVDGERFVLRGEHAAIVVRPEPGAVEVSLERGARVTVLGIAEAFSRLQVAELERLLESGRHPALQEAPTDLAGPFISADEMRPA